MDKHLRRRQSGTGGVGAPCKGAGLPWVQSPPGNWVAPAGSNRSGGGGNEAAGATDAKGQRVAPRAGRPQRVVNAEQAPKAVMSEPTRPTSGEGRRRRVEGKRVE